MPGAFSYPTPFEFDQQPSTGRETPRKEDYEEQLPGSSAKSRTKNVKRSHAYPTPFEFDEQPASVREESPQKSHFTASHNGARSSATDRTKNVQRTHAYPTPFEFDQLPSIGRSPRNDRSREQLNRSSAEEETNNLQSSRRRRSHNDRIPESSVRRDHRPSSNSDDASSKAMTGGDTYKQNWPLPSPRRKSRPLRSKSNDDSFFASLEGERAPKPRPTLPKTKSGRFLPKPTVSRSRTSSGALNKTSKASREDFVRSPPGKTQSAGNLDAMRHSIAEGPLKVPVSPLRKPPASPVGKSRMPPASPSRRKLWLISPGKKGKGVENRSFSKIKGVLPASDHGPSPGTPSQSKRSLSRTIHTHSPTEEDCGSDEKKKSNKLHNLLSKKSPGRSKSADLAGMVTTADRREADRGNDRRARAKRESDERKRTKAFQNLLSNRSPGRSKSSDLTGMARTRDRSMSPIRGEPSKSIEVLPSINICDDNDEVSLSPERSKPASAAGLVAGLWSSFNGSFRRDDDDGSEEDCGFKSASQERGRLPGTASPPAREESSLSPSGVKNPVSTGLITGFIDKMYDSFMNEDDADNSDEDEFGIMHNSVSRLDRRINQLAGLQ